MKTKWCVAGFLMLVLCAGIPSRADESIEATKAKAENGDTEAESNLGFCYATGNGIAKDATVAVKWYRKAAEQGLAVAQANLAALYAKGEGIETNLVEAAKWYRKAADQGDASAEYNLGCMYYYGDGLKKDPAQALKWFQKAADQGEANAQCNIGLMYAEGSGVSCDNAEAVKWFRKATEQHYALGQRMLGHAYMEGKGVPQSYADAASWYRKAAEQGDEVAQFQLGLLYAEGNGVPKDYVEAYKWWNVCASRYQASQTPKENLLKLERKMTPIQIAEAQSRSAAFIPHEETPSSNSGNLISSDNPKFSGTGFFITDDGYLISNYHVIKNAAKLRLLTGTGLLDVAVVTVDAANDLALLKAIGAVKPLPIAASRTVKLGGTVATVGFPDIGLQGFAPKLAKGEIASLSGAADDPRYFQISLPVQPGNSGGALVDARGNVVGIVAARLDASVALAATGSLPENVNYAVKSSLLLSFLESVPDVSAKLKEPNTKDEAFEDVVKSAQDAAVLVLVY